MLEVESTATPAQLREAYRSLVKVWHPDRFEGALRAKAEVRMREINAAHDTLKSPVQRAAYDRQLTMRQASQDDSVFERIFGLRVAHNHEAADHAPISPAARRPRLRKRDPKSVQPQDHGRSADIILLIGLGVVALLFERLFG